MCSNYQNFKCCSTENVFDASGNANQSYPHVVNKQLPPKVLEPIVQNKVVEVPKEVYMEKIIEVPQIKTVEKIVEQIKPIIKYKNVYKPKTVYVEKIRNVDKIIYQERIIEVPQIKTVEKVVDVPVYVNRERIVPVPRYMVVERVIPVLKVGKEERTMEIPEVNSPHIDVDKQVDTKERIEVNDLKENQTTEVVEDKEIQILNELSGASVNIESATNIESAQEHLKVAPQENMCASIGCKFLPLYRNFVKVAAPVFGSFPRKVRYASNENVNKVKQSVFPRIRIARTPNNHNNNRSLYCNCS